MKHQELSWRKGRALRGSAAKTVDSIDFGRESRGLAAHEILSEKIKERRKKYKVKKSTTEWLLFDPDRRQTNVTHYSGVIWT